MTRLSTKGQVVVPAWARARLKLAPGDRLKVEMSASDQDALVLRKSQADTVAGLIRRGAWWFKEGRASLVEALHRRREEEREREARRRRP